MCIMADYIPGNDSVFKDWLSNFTSYVTGNKAVLGLADTDVTALTSATSGVMMDIPAHASAIATAKAAMQKKKHSREAAEKAIRKLVKQIQANPAVTDSQREAMRITVTKERTSTSAPTDVPLVKIDHSNRLVHTVKIYSSPTSRRRPMGVIAAEIWAKVAGAAEFVLLATTPQPRYAAEFQELQVGKPVDYQVRWMNKAGQVGPWSLLASAVVPG